MADEAHSRENYQPIDCTCDSDPLGRCVVHPSSIGCPYSPTGFALRDTEGKCTCIPVARRPDPKYSLDNPPFDAPELGK